jgi:hypothetical protein
MEFLTSLENSGVGSWVRQSTSIWAFPSILTLHTVGLGLLVGTTTIVDLRILGAAPAIALGPMERFVRIMWIGFWLNALSGTALFIAGATRHATNPTFYVKMTFIALGMVTVQLLHRHVFLDDGVGPAEQIPVKGKVLAGLSLALWTGAIIAGRLMAYVGVRR